MGIRNEIGEKGFVSYFDEDVSESILVFDSVIKGQKASTVQITSNTALSSESGSVVLVNASLSRVILTLPSINGLDGFILYIKKTDQTINEVEIKGQTGELIDGDSSKILNLPYTSIKIVSNNNNWWII